MVFKYAIMFKGHLHICKWLLTLPEKYGIDLKTAKDIGLFSLAASYNRINICKWFLSLLEEYKFEIGTDTDSNSFFNAAGNGHLDLCKWLIRIKDNIWSKKAFEEAARTGHLDLCKWLISLPERYGINSAAKYIDALMYAASGDHLDVCEWLIKKYKINPSIYDNLAFRLAAENGALKVCEWLYKEFKVNPSAEDNDAFKEAAKNCHLHICKWLWSLPGKEGISSVFNIPKTFVFAAMFEQLDLCKWLIDKMECDTAVMIDEALRSVMEEDRFCESDIGIWLKEQI